MSQREINGMVREMAEKLEKDLERWGAIESRLAYLESKQGFFAHREPITPPKFPRILLQYGHRPPEKRAT